MLKRFRRGFEAWGHYLLALLCAAVILMSAAWTREQRTAEQAEQQALSDQSQRLSEVTPTQGLEAFLRPTDGDMLRGYSEHAVYFPALRAWQPHLAVDFAAAEGAIVRAMRAGTVVSCEAGCVRLLHADGTESLYRGIQQTDVSPGQAVRRGAGIGRAGARVAHEGCGHICVAVIENGEAIQFDTEE